LKEIIEHILEEEKAARDRVEDARKKSKQIRINTESESRKMISAAQEKGVKDSKAFIKKVQEDAQKEKEQEMEKITQTGESLWEEKESQVKGIIDVLFKNILGEDLSK